MSLRQQTKLNDPSELLPAPHLLLEPLWNAKRERQPSYSLRALARDIQVDPGHLSRIFSGKKVPTSEIVQALQIPLDLTNDEVAVLKTSIALHSRSADKSREVLADLILKNRVAQSASEHTRQDLTKLAHLKTWAHIAFLDLTTCSNFRNDDRWIARRLGISLSHLSEIVATLVNLGLIERADGVWKKTSSRIVFPSDKTSLATRQYHHQMIEKALQMMLTRTAPGDVARRRVTGATIAANPEHLPKAIERLNQCLFEITSMLSEGECTEVYQLNLQLVPLTLPDGGEE